MPEKLVPCKTLDGESGNPKSLPTHGFTVRDNTVGDFVCSMVYHKRFKCSHRVWWVCCFSVCLVDFNIASDSQVSAINLGDACKVAPSKFSGSNEVVPFHFRSQVGSFKFFCVGLWCLDVRVDSKTVTVYRCRRWAKLLRTELLPGDVVSIRKLSWKKFSLTSFFRKAAILHTQKSKEPFLVILENAKLQLPLISKEEMCGQSSYVQICCVETLCPLGNLQVRPASQPLNGRFQLLAKDLKKVFICVGVLSYFQVMITVTKRSKPLQKSMIYAFGGDNIELIQASSAVLRVIHLLRVREITFPMGIACVQHQLLVGEVAQVGFKRFRFFLPDVEISCGKEIFKPEKLVPSKILDNRTSGEPKTQKAYPLVDSQLAITLLAILCAVWLITNVSSVGFHDASIASGWFVAAQLAHLSLAFLCVFGGFHFSEVYIGPVVVCLIRRFSVWVFGAWMLGWKVGKAFRYKSAAMKPLTQAGGEDKTVPADMLLLLGIAIVNEAILAGKSTSHGKLLQTAGNVVSTINKADACKVTPAKFSGSKEVMPHHFCSQLKVLFNGYYCSKFCRSSPLLQLGIAVRYRPAARRRCVHWETFNTYWMRNKTVSTEILLLLGSAFVNEAYPDRRVNPSMEVAGEGSDKRLYMCGDQALSACNFQYFFTVVYITFFVHSTSKLLVGEVSSGGLFLKLHNGHCKSRKEEVIKESQNRLV
ncbi:unnamed protein product [Cochlearia groenlandica]